MLDAQKSDYEALCVALHRTSMARQPGDKFSVDPMLNSVIGTMQKRLVGHRDEHLVGEWVSQWGASFAG